MSQINFGMLNDGGGFQNALMQGVQYGTHLRQQKQAQEREAAVDNAYRGMIAGDPNAVNALAQVDPRAAYQMKAGQDQTAQAERERQPARDIERMQRREVEPEELVGRDHG